MFYSYLLQKNGQYPNEMPQPPINDALFGMIGILADKAFDGLDSWFTKGKDSMEDAIPLIGPFLQYDSKVEESVIKQMAVQCAIPDGYQAVKVELLYGSHSAEIQLTLLGQSGNIVKCDVIASQGYDVILNMMNNMQALVDHYGGISYHEGVAWKYSMVE